MILSQKTKRDVILGFIAILALLAVFSPFLISKESFQSLFLLIDFLAVIFLWHEFNQLRLKINKRELEDEKLSEIEHDIEIRNSLIPEDKKEKK